MEESKNSTLQKIAPLLLEWYERNARSLPWRIKSGKSSTPDPYHVWISEIMLQQTRVDTVKGYYQRFLKALPEIKDLAMVPEDDLMKLWQGLGYYSRARNLQKAAKIIMDDYQGIFPSEYEQILSLPGIGEYTAGAISSIAFSKPVPAVDGNVYRIYTRVFEDDSDITRASFKKELRHQLESVIPGETPGKFNQAWMDLGATVCLPHGTPLCKECPFQDDCLAGKHSTWQNFPVKPQKKQRQIQERTVILLEYQGKYLLQKRPPQGLLAGLWEFPSQEEYLSLQELQAQIKEWKVSDPQIELLGKGKHIFSHIEWHMLGYLIHLNQMPEITFSEDSVWVTAEKMQKEYSIPSAFRCYYSKLY